MRLFYLVTAIVISVVILVISFAQFGATCSWYLFSSGTAPLIVLMEMSVLGAVVGGLMVMYFITPKKKVDDEETSDDVSAE